MFYISIDLAQALIAERYREAERARQALSLRPSTRRPSLRWQAAAQSPEENPRPRLTLRRSSPVEARPGWEQQ